MKYSKVRKQAVLARLSPPLNRPVAEVAAEEGVCEGTLYLWRRQAREQGELYANAGTEAEGWSARDSHASSTPEPEAIQRYTVADAGFPFAATWFRRSGPRRRRDPAGCSRDR